MSGQLHLCMRGSHHRLVFVPLPTLWADFTGADKVALVAHQDDWQVWLGLPEEEAELGGAVETSPVSHWEDQDTHIALQSGQVLGMQAHTYAHMN